MRSPLDNYQYIVIIDPGYGRHEPFNQERNSIEILKKVTDEENQVEARLSKISIGYTVGVWDLDAEEYFPGLTIFTFEKANALELAEDYFQRVLA